MVASVTGSVRIAVVSGGVLSVLGAALVTAALPMLWRFDAREHPGGEPRRPRTGLDHPGPAAP